MQYVWLVTLLMAALVLAKTIGQPSSWIQCSLNIYLLEHINFFVLVSVSVNISLLSFPPFFEKYNSTKNSLLAGYDVASTYIFIYLVSLPPFF